MRSAYPRARCRSAALHGGEDSRAISFRRASNTSGAVPDASSRSTDSAEGPALGTPSRAPVT
ncbi:Uncharacterised protein [Mycobacteroides abscessus subsp. abscessus]|nr:Uncharacterised protein [Mycobacteroides abscessus subsp. abscessus]